MNNKKNGGQVYPVLGTGMTGNLFQEDGMTMRQRYKMAALQGYLSNGGDIDIHKEHIFQERAEMLGVIANAMIAEDQEFEKNNKSDS